MVDFGKLQRAKGQSASADPSEIFRRLPKPKGINDLYTSQAQVLEQWQSRRNERDILLKLHTGGGKTLVALLIAQAVINESHEPVLYLCPNNQLVGQIMAKAKEYGISAVQYQSGAGGDFPEAFMSGQAVLVGPYAALFNGRSRFGVRGSGREITKVSTVIVDDAHAASGSIRQAFTLRISRGDQPTHYAYLTHLFRQDFGRSGRLGTFGDVVETGDDAVLEVPYWAWMAKSHQVQEYIHEHLADGFPFVWPLLRDAFDVCHALVSSHAFVVTPLLPLVDLIPTFSECRRRIFMSATITDSSAIVRTFDADPKSIGKPIASKSLAGISERMILAPELMPLTVSVKTVVQELVEHVVDEDEAGTVILVPSEATAKHWSGLATYGDSPDEVETQVQRLVAGESRGPFVWANRYDGIDLPGEACRCLVLDGLPRGVAEYERFRASTLAGGTSMNALQAERIEQGMGRAARGPGDFCVVVVTGKDLIAWLGRYSNQGLLTAGTRAQVEMGLAVSREVTNKEAFLGVVRQCLNRDSDWLKYHAESLAELTEDPTSNPLALDVASRERRALRLVHDAHFDKAISVLTKPFEGSIIVDPVTQSWLEQLAARAAHYWGDAPLSQELQEHAYKLNRNLQRPQVVPAYVPTVTPGPQAHAIVANIERYRPRRGLLAHFDQIVSLLVPTSSANQFEESLRELGSLIGFQGERPETSDGVGPDVLWLMPGRMALVIEAKSRQLAKNPLNKDALGQLLAAADWFKANYPDWSFVPVSVHATGKCTTAGRSETCRVLTFDDLNSLIVKSRSILQQLCNSNTTAATLEARCQDLLKVETLTPGPLENRFLRSYEVAD